MHRKDLNNKNKVYIYLINNTKSHITIETNLPYTLVFLIIDQFLLMFTYKKWKRF
jgi:hypothetical protein